VDDAPDAGKQFAGRVQKKGESIKVCANVMQKLNRNGWSDQMAAQRDFDLKNRFVEKLRSQDLRKWLRLEHDDLGFTITVIKAWRYVGIKKTSKPKKAFVRFASAERDPTVNAITSSTVDL